VVTLRRPAVVLMTANDAARGKQIFDSGEYAPKPEANGHHGGYQRGDQHGDHHPDDPGPEPLADEGQHTLLADLFTAADLDSMTFAPLVEHVPNLITEGFGILAGPPKAGKSWLANGLALACAQGGTALGAIDVEPRRVLLLALEDGQRRLKERLRHLNYGEPLPYRLNILTSITLRTAAATIEEWLTLYGSDSRPPLVILDTLGRARPQRKGRDDPYIADYQLGAAIKGLVDKVPGAALLATHHTRKMAAADWLDAVSGTQGIAGSADYVLILSRKRKSNEGTLAVTGRDIAENEYALKIMDGIWSIDGMDMMDAAAAVETRREEEKQERRSDRSLEALRFVNESANPITAHQLAQHLSATGTNCTSNVAGNLLLRLYNSQLIDRPARGVYGPKA
jgi:hypothetical protein